MFLGHYGAALAAKKVSPRLSLGTTVLGAQLVDLVWPVFLLIGLERVRIEPGRMAASSLEFVHYPFTHSLLSGIGWAVLAGGLYYALKRSTRGTWVLGALVLSHWLMDLPFHEPDLPLWPGSSVRLGGGLWSSLPATVVLELALLAGGLALYARATVAVDRVGRWGLWGMIAVLLAFYLMGLTAPPPSESSLAWGGLTLWVFVPLAAWVDRHREGANQSSDQAPRPSRDALSTA